MSENAPTVPKEVASELSPEETHHLIEIDRDSLHILPLSMIPLETVHLRRFRLIKNIRLESVIEVYSERQAGSGQMEISALNTLFGWPDTPEHPDLVVLRNVGNLPSFDVYSLRVLLRRIGVEISNHDDLKLSKRKSAELHDYMLSFTRPLIQQIYGDQNLEVGETVDLVSLFRDPEAGRVREKLEIMSRKLEIEVEEVPKFLEDYGDIFLSLSYYRQCLDAIAPIITDFLGTMETIRNNWQMQHQNDVMQTCDLVEGTINDLASMITGRFEYFDRNSKAMWDNISADRFRKVENIIKSYHSTTGGVLCALSVKMQAWKQTFPVPDTAGPVKLANFIMSEMKQGLDKITDMLEADKAAAEHGPG